MALVQSPEDASIPAARAWTASQPPRHILAIRLQAMGDVVITLPYLNDLKRRYPETAIDLLTREETGAIPKNLELFRRVRTIGGGRNFKRQWLASARLLPQLFGSRYDVVLDLQNNEISRFVTKCLRPHAWSRFDKTSPRSAGERTRHTIEAAGLGPVRLNTELPTRGAEAALRLLKEAGWREDHRLVALNPAGAFPTRNWPLQSWVGFARAWQSLDSTPTQFLLLGLDTMKAKASFIEGALAGRALNLVGRTTPDEAFSIVQKADLVLSEDSGLMHMAWVSGVPTLALFGSSRGDWSRPLGERTLCLHSGDLACGSCMEATCRYGDVHCLTRYEPRPVAERAFSLLRPDSDSEDN